MHSMLIYFYPYSNMYLSYFLLSLFLLFLAFLLAIKNDRMNKKTVLFMFLFIYTQFFIFAINGTTPFYRTFSGMVWVGGLLLLILSRNRIVYNPSLVYKTLLIVLFFVAVLILYQYFILGLPRPKATFVEPSKAALALYSGAASITGIIYLYNLKIRDSFKMFIALSVFFVGGLITLSMHIVTFAIMVLIIIYLKPPFTFSKINKRQFLQGVLINLFACSETLFY